MIQTLIIEDIEEKFDQISDNLIKKIKSIDDIIALKKLYSNIIDCSNLKEISNLIYNKSYSFGKNAFKYKQNYDAIVKWISQEFKGKTLEIFGVETGRIVEVFTFEPVDIKIHTGRLDLIFKDENNLFYHCEEERNMTQDDLFRCGIYHFQSVRELGTDVTDVILISGRKYNGPYEITTKSGVYKPVIIDLTTKNGQKCLEEIKQEINEGNYSRLIELIFLPLYGKEQGYERSRLVKDVIRYEIDLLKKDQIFEKLVAATLIMCNKILDKHVLEEFYEEIKNMVDILEIAREDGLKQGLEQGFEQGMLKDAREMVFEVLQEKIGVVPSNIVKKIKMINTRETLKGLLLQAVKSDDFNYFDSKLSLALS